MDGAQLLGLSRQERELISFFSANEKITVTADDVIEIRDCSRTTANQFLYRLTQKFQRKSVQIIGGIKCRVWVKKSDDCFGLKTIWFGSNKVEVADPSRLIIDILDKPDFGGGGYHTIDVVRAYWNSEIHDSEQILEYATRYGKGTVMKRLGFLTEEFDAPVSKSWLKKCRHHLSAGISNLDPNSPARGKITSKWNLRINLPL